MNERYLYLLTREPHVTQYDANRAMVVCARSTKVARQIASEAAGDEGKATWLSTNQSTCNRIGAAFATVAEGMVLRDFNAG